MEVQAPIALESRILTTDAIYVADKLPQTVRSFKIPLPDLILLRMQILFASRFTRNVLTEFESRAVNPITGSQRRRQDEPGHECRASSMLQLFRQDVRRIGPEVGSKKFVHLRLRQFREEFLELRLSITQRKIIVRLVKSSFANRPITLGRVNASARKMTSGQACFTSPITHSQKAKGFVCGLSTRKIRTSCSIQYMMTLFNSCHRARHWSVSNSNGKIS